MGGSRIQERLLLTLGQLLALLLLALMTLRCWLQLGKSWTIALEATNHAIIIRLAVLLLDLLLLSLSSLAFIPQMWWDASVDVVDSCDFWLNKPRRTGPCLSSDGLLDEGSKNLLCEDLAVSSDVRIVHNSFLLRSIV